MIGRINKTRKEIQKANFIRKEFKRRGLTGKKLSKMSEEEVLAAEHEVSVLAAEKYGGELDVSPEKQAEYLKQSKKVKTEGELAGVVKGQMKEIEKT